MRARPVVLVSTSAVALLAVALVGCSAAGPQPDPSPTAVAPTASTSATPIPQALVVAGGERPPVVADGECGAITSLEALSTATGRTVDVLERRDPLFTVAEDNLGGLTCDFSGPEIGGRLVVYAAGAFAGTGLPLGDVSLEPVPCVNACEWHYADDTVLVVGYISPSALGSEAATAVGEALGPLISEAVGDSDDAVWRRDTSEWWPVRDCSEVAAAVGDGTGISFTGRPGAFFTGDSDPQRDVGWLAQNRTACLLDDPAVEAEDEIEVTFTSGTAWSVPYPYAGGTEPFDAGVTGMTVFRSPANGLDGGGRFQLTDGVNGLDVAFAQPRDDGGAVVAALAGFVR